MKGKIILLTILTTVVLTIFFSKILYAKIPNDSNYLAKSFFKGYCAMNDKDYDGKKDNCKLFRNRKIEIIDNKIGNYLYADNEGYEVSNFKNYCTRSYGGELIKIIGSANNYIGLSSLEIFYPNLAEEKDFEFLKGREYRILSGKGSGLFLCYTGKSLTKIQILYILMYPHKGYNGIYLKDIADDIQWAIKIDVDWIKYNQPKYIAEKIFQNPKPTINLSYSIQTSLDLKFVTNLEIEFKEILEKTRKNPYDNLE